MRVSITLNYEEEPEAFGDKKRPFRLHRKAAEPASMEELNKYVDSHHPITERASRSTALTLAQLIFPLIIHFQRRMGHYRR
jgi:hypothetical protein